MSLSDPLLLTTHEWQVLANDGLSAERYAPVVIQTFPEGPPRLLQCPRFGGIPVEHLGNLPFDDKGDLTVDARHFYRAVGIAEDNRVLVCQLYQTLPGPTARFGKGFSSG